jgi:hypothetical protein
VSNIGARVEVVGEGGLDDIKLSHDLEVLATRESNHDSREATLEVKQKALQDTRLMVMACELAANVRETNLDTRVAELSERKKQLAER